MSLSTTSQEVVSLARAIRNYWDAELPKRHPDYPIVHSGEDSGPPPPEEKQLQALLMDLPEDTLYKLALIMYLGRGDFRAEDLPRQFEYLKNTFTKPEWVISQMIEKASLADYLTDGLAELKRHEIDLDHLTLTPVSAG